MIGKIIRELRIEKGVTQSDLSNYLGLTPKMISFYELGERFPPHDIIIKLAYYFDVSTDYILGRSDIKNPEKLLLNESSPEYEPNSKTESTMELSELESNLLAMFRLLDNRDKRDIYDNTYCKYKRVYRDSSLYPPCSCYDTIKNDSGCNEN